MFDFPIAIATIATIQLSMTEENIRLNAGYSEKKYY